MGKRGCKCDKAEELFDHPSILSTHSPDNWVKASEFISEKPLTLPLKCYEYGPAFLRYCEDCQIVYKKRWYFTDDGKLEDLYCGTLGDICPHCGKLGAPVSELYQAAYGPYLEKEYDYYRRDDFGDRIPVEVIEISEQRALEEALSMCYDELGGYFSEDEGIYYGDDETEDCDFLGYEKIELLEGPELDYLYRKHLFEKKLCLQGKS